MDTEEWVVIRLKATGWVMSLTRSMWISSSKNNHAWGEEWDLLAEGLTEDVANAMEELGNE